MYGENLRIDNAIFVEENKAAINYAIVKKAQIETDKVLYGKAYPDTKLVIISYNSFADKADSFYRWTFTHELGHTLKLSTRLAPNKQFDDEHHDEGPFPNWLDVKNSLMSSGRINQDDINPSAWLRHEDWRAANKSALDIINPQ